MSREIHTESLICEGENDDEHEGEVRATRPTHGLTPDETSLFHVSAIEVSCERVSHEDQHGDRALPLVYALHASDSHDGLIYSKQNLSVRACHRLQMPRLCVSSKCAILAIEPHDHAVQAQSRMALGRGFNMPDVRRKNEITIVTTGRFQCGW